MKLNDILKNNSLFDLDNFDIVLLDNSGNKYNLDYCINVSGKEILLNINTNY